MTELQKVTAWAKAAKAHPTLQALFPPSATEKSGVFFLWAGSYEEYEPGHWSHPGWDLDDEDGFIEDMGGDGIEQTTLLRWSDVGAFASIEWPGKPAEQVADWRVRSARILRSQSISYQWYCAHPERAGELIDISEMEEWGKDKVPSIEEIVEALVTNPIKPDFPQDHPTLFDVEVSA